MQNITHCFHRSSVLVLYHIFEFQPWAHCSLYKMFPNLFHMLYYIYLCHYFSLPHIAFRVYFARKGTTSFTTVPSALNDSTIRSEFLINTSTNSCSTLKWKAGVKVFLRLRHLSPKNQYKNILINFQCFPRIFICFTNSVR